MKEIVLVGGGGHCKSVIEVIESKAEFKIAGIIDATLPKGSTVSGYTVLGKDEDLDHISQKYSEFHLAVGSIKTADTRERLFLRLKEYKGSLPVISASTSYVSKRSLIGEGCIIMHNAFINAAVRLGVNCIVNTGAVVEHDVIVGNHSHISTTAVLNGNVKVGDHCFIGSNCVVREGVVIGNNVVIGAGSVVLKDVEDNSVIAGNPSKSIIRK